MNRVAVVTGGRRGIGAATVKRGGTPAEVAHAMLWLLSDEASYTTGSFIDVTGGK